MRFDTSQQARLSQQMKLGPRMIQSMEILQMPVMALQERVDQELESNVALELIEPRGDPDSQPTEPEDDRLDDRELVIDEKGDAAADWQRLGALESNYAEAFDNQYSSNSSTYSPTRQAGERDRKMDALNNVAAREAGLTEQLLNQWTFAEVDDEIARLGEMIISFIDDDGLLGADLETIFEQNRNVPGAGSSLDGLTRALDEVQHRLDPPGIGARTRQEALLLQIDRLLDDPDSDTGFAVVQTLVRDHYDDLLQNRLPRIAQEAGLTIDEIGDAMHLMRRLNVSPGRELVDDDVPPIMPDVIVEYDDDADEYIARLADGALPALRVSRHYETMSKDRDIDKSAREFVGASVRNAHWLIDAINQRKSTLLRVVGIVLARQREFLDYGPQHLKPLPMIEVADQLGIHVGTVSRAVAEKWLQTPRGLVPLRKLFTGGTATSSGEDVSWAAIKAKLKEIIDAEDKSKPMSDAALADELKRTGIDIARRTVVKYRQQLDIPPARRRRVY